MKKLFYQFLVLVIVLFSFLTKAKAQTIQLNNSRFDNGTYSIGGHIAAPVNASGCFDNTNIFELYISVDNFSTETKIGSINGSYTTFVNGIIPTNFLPTANAKIRIKSTSPQQTSTASAAFSIGFPQVGSLDTVDVAPTERPLILNPQTAYGWCSYKATGSTLELIQTGNLTSNFSAAYYNEISSPATRNDITPTLGKYTINLGKAHYTFIAKTKNPNGSIGTRAYFLVNSPNNIALASEGQQKGCLPDSLFFSLVLDAASGGIENNFPTTRFKVDWGDGLPAEYYTLCQLIERNGRLAHYYSKNSCEASGGSFVVKAKIESPFSATKASTSTICSEPTVSSTAKIYNKPKAKFDVNPVTNVINDQKRGCVNIPVTFYNTSTPGYSDNGNDGCSGAAMYYWYVDGVKKYSSIDKEAVPNFIYTFTTPGMHEVRLEVDNLSCDKHDTTLTICIEQPPVPAFTFEGGALSIQGCTPKFTPINNSTNGDCGKPKYLWKVLDSLLKPTSPSNYNISNPAAETPTITILQPGKYKVQLCLINTCGTNFCVEHDVTSIGNASVNFPQPVVKYCANTQAVNFATEASHKPAYISQQSSFEEYTWTIVPKNAGTFIFDNATTATSKFPTITFNGTDSFLVKVAFKNDCGIKVDSQWVVLNIPAVITTRLADTAVCYSTNTISVKSPAITSGVYDFSTWYAISPSNGSLVVNAGVATYTLTNTDKLKGSAAIEYVVYNKQPCAAYRDTMLITIYPNNFGVDTVVKTCSGTPIYVPLHSSVSTSTFTYTAQTVYGTVAGLTASGSGTSIKDSLVCTTAANDSAVVVYTITPLANGCVGNTYTVKVTVYPVPSITVNPLTQSICSYDYTNISLQSNVSYATYNWLAVASNASVSGYSSSPSFISTNLIKQKLINTASSIETVEYTIQAAGKNGCLSNKEKSVISINSAPSIPDAGRDTILCNATSYNLIGNVPALGTASWQQLGNMPTTATLSGGGASNTTTASGLVPGEYLFKYSITPVVVGCPFAEDTVKITVRPALTLANAGKDSAICNYKNGNVISFALNGNTTSGRSYEQGLWTVISQPTNGSDILGGLNNPKATIVVSKAGKYILTWQLSNDAGCIPTIDTVEYNVLDNPDIAFAGNDTILCSETSFVLKGNPSQLGGTVSWTQVGGSTTITALPANTPTVTVSNILPDGKPYTFKYEISGSFCPSTSDDIVVISMPPIFDTIITAAPTICSGQTVTIQTQKTIGGTGVYSYQWQSSINGTNYTAILNEKQASITVTPTQSVYLRLRILSGECTFYTSPILVTVKGAIGNNTIAASAAVCIGNAPAKIIGAVPTGGDGVYGYQWQQFNGTSFIDIVGETSKDFTPPVLYSTAYYRRLVSNNLCGAGFGISSNVDTIVVNNNAKATLQDSLRYTCVPVRLDTLVKAINLIPENGTYEWYINQNYIGAGKTMPTTTYTNAPDSITVKLKVLSAFGCKPDSAFTKVYTQLSGIIPQFTSSHSLVCAYDSVTFTNTSAHQNLLKFKWTFGDKEYYGVQPPKQVFIPHPQFIDSVYTISLTSYTICDSIVKTMPITVRSKPKVLLTPDKTRACSPATINFTNQTWGDNNTYQWYFDSANVATQLPHLVTISKANQTKTYYTGVTDTVYTKLIATNSCGTDTQSYSIIVEPNVIALNVIVPATQYIGCAPHVVQLKNNSFGATSYIFNLADKPVNPTQIVTPNGFDTINAVYNKAGNYTISIRAINSCSDTTAYRNIKVYATPKANFNVLRDSICIGDSLRVSNTSDTATSYVWNFGDGSNATVVNPVKKYNSSGQYKVKLTANLSNPDNGLVCWDTISKLIRVADTFSTNIIASAYVSNCKPFTVNFTNNTLGSGITEWFWNDGTAKSIGTSATHTFTDTGSYNVMAILKTNEGCTYKGNALIRVNGPSATLAYTHGVLCNGASVQFTVSGLYYDSIKYVFGNNDSLVTKSSQINYTYLQSGKYIPSIELIANNGNCRYKIKGNDTITIDKIKAGFYVTQQAICGNTKVSYTDTTKSYFSVANRNWILANGQSSTALAPVQNLANGGNYIVSLKATTVNGCSDTASLPVNIKVQQLPVITSIQTTSIGCLNQPITYTANISSVDNVPLQNYVWKLSNGNTATGNNIVNNYTSIGSYVDTLIVSTIYGCADTLTTNINVNPSPTVNINPDQRETLICKGKSVELKAVGGNNSSYTWLSSDALSCPTCANIIVSPTNNTQYVVVNTNSFGCKASDTITVNVVAPLKISIVGKDSVCIGESTTLTAVGATRYQWSPTLGLSDSVVAKVIARPLSTTKYLVTGNDAYNCFTDTASYTVKVGEYPVVEIGDNITSITGKQITFTPAFTNGPITNWFWTPSQNLSCTNCASPILTVKRSECYRVFATNAFNCTASDTVCVKAFCVATQVFIPNAFTPDGDGVNDVFMVRGTGIMQVKSFRIFNRWGQVVFDRANIAPNDKTKGWNGNIGSVPAPSDVYVYTCEVLCDDGTPYTYTGNVSLLK